jgi:hypothetical protein
MAKKKPHQQGSKLAQMLPPEALCKCGKRPKTKPERCPLHGVLPPFEGDGLCECCPSCRSVCFYEV